jgi:predicted DNA-binding transcriptional regulator YafY
MSISLETLHRQWQTLRMIPRHPRKITGRELTDRLANAGFPVTKRTVERDLQTLSAFFPLVVDSRSMPYGWSWDKGAAALDVPALSPTEAISFLMLRDYMTPLIPASLLDQLAPYFGMAEQCLMAQGSESPLRGWLKKIAIVPVAQPLQPPTISPEVLASLQDGLLRGVQVRIRYLRRGEKAEAEYIAHPLGLVQRGGVLYLVATLFDYDDVRLLVVHRMRLATVLDDSARRLKGFDLATYVAEGHFGFGSSVPFIVVLRFDREAGEHLWDTPLSVDQQIIGLPDGRMEVRATVTDSLQLRWWLLGFADGVEVVEPARLRDQLATKLRQAAARYD